MMRLQKYMASKGIASRRKSEEYIAAGLVKVNKKTVTEMGFLVDPEKDLVEYDGAQLKKEEEKLIYYALNKPLGFVSAAQKTKCEKNIVTDLVPKAPRVFPVGRLDKETTGLIILTNDGRLTFNLTHPSKEHEKEYIVKVKPAISDTALDKLRKGVPILGQETRPCLVERLSKSSFKITLTEGKNRHIRRICRKVGSEVVDLKRIRIGSFYLEGIKEGSYKVLSTKEVKDLSSFNSKASNSKSCKGC
jgi:pseudouridine synthase